MSTLTCNTCTETAEDVKTAIAHVTISPSHTMTGPAAIEGATVTISVSDDEDEDEGFYDDWDDDWDEDEE